MTTIVNNPAPVQTPAPETQDRGGTGFLIGAVLLILFVAALLYFGIPAIKRMGPIQIQANVPTPQVVVPNNINVTTTPETTPTK